MAIRWIDAGTVPYLRSQTIYHGLAYARTESTPDTVVVATPAEPYVCVGFHQDLEHELDLDFCRERGLQIVRRETGGGAVYLDSDQLFVQWIMAPSSVPMRVDRRFELFTRPLVATYRELGIDARFVPINDIHVGRRKITGTGAAHIGEAEVLTGNFLLDFDVEVMARVLRQRTPRFREQVRASLGEYMTWLSRELEVVPSRSEITEICRRHCETALGGPLEAGELTDAERDAIAMVEARFVDPEFVHREGGLRRDGVKIHEQVRVLETGDGGARVAVRADTESEPEIIES